MSSLRVESIIPLYDERAVVILGSGQNTLYYYPSPNLYNAGRRTNYILPKLARQKGFVKIKKTPNFVNRLYVLFMRATYLRTDNMNKLSCVMNF